MAHNLPDGIVLNVGARVILDRPKLAALLGAVTNEWSMLEGDVMDLYALLMGAYLPKWKSPLRQRLDPPKHAVAVQVFDTLENLPNRLKLLEKLAEWTLKKDQSLLSELKPITKLIQKTSRRRSKLVHAVWATADEYPDALIWLSPFERRLAYEASDFNETIDFIIGTIDVVTKFKVKVIAFLGKPES